MHRRRLIKAALSIPLAMGIRPLEALWIAFKVMAAGAIPPRRAFPHAYNNGADFILAGMFDWQIEEDVKVAAEALASVQRDRPRQS